MTQQSTHKRVEELYYFFLADEIKTSSFTTWELAGLLRDYHKKATPSLKVMLNHLAEIADYECYADFLDENSLKENSPQSVQALITEIDKFIENNIDPLLDDDDLINQYQTMREELHD